MRPRSRGAPSGSWSAFSGGLTTAPKLLCCRFAHDSAEARRLETDMNSGPKHYRSMEEFTREEIRSHIKLGWSLDDLYDEANIYFRPSSDDDGEPSELDFDF